MTTPHVPRSASLLVAALGVVGLGGNVAAVALLQGSPHAYKAESLGPWLGELLKTRAETEYAAVAFTVGLVALAAFFLELAALAPSPTAALGARLAALGAFFDAVGTPAPGIVARLSRGTPLVGAEAWLDLTIWLDATFNLFLGLGLVVLTLGARRAAAWPGWLTALGLAAGGASVVGFGQLWSDTLAGLLALSGPLWLVFVSTLIVRVARRGEL